MEYTVQIISKLPATIKERINIITHQYSETEIHPFAKAISLDFKTESLTTVVGEATITTEYVGDISIDNKVIVADPHNISGASAFAKTIPQNKYYPISNLIINSKNFACSSIGKSPYTKVFMLCCTIY